MSDDIEMLRAEVERLSNRLEWEQRCHRVATQKLVSVETERDSLRAKLERAKETLGRLSAFKRISGDSIYARGQNSMMDQMASIASTFLSAHSGDAPAQQTQISDEAVDAALSAYWNPPMDNEHYKRMKAAINAAIGLKRNPL
jgi:Zn-dependent peptidase ImmA (M78 family)